MCPEGPSFERLNWGDVDRRVTALAHQYSAVFRQQILDGTKARRQPTIALLGVGHTFAYLATQLALVKLGLRVLLLSPGNSGIARDHLLTVCDVVGVVAEEQLVPSAAGIDTPVTPMLTSQHLDASSKDLIVFEPDDLWNSHSFIIHSSGTTGLPKPIIHTHRSMMLIARMYRLFPEFYISNWYLAFPL